MTDSRPGGVFLTEGDLDFLVQEVAPNYHNVEELKRLIREDRDFRSAFVGHERVFRRVMDDESVLLRISPALYFEVLLRQALKQMEGLGHTVELMGEGEIPVFDTRAVLELAARWPLLEYLSDMLSSFTRVESRVMPVRIASGVWRRVKFSDMDVDSLLRLCQMVEGERRFGYYKRIADLCLFITGIFPEHAYFDYRHPVSGAVQAGVRAGRRGMQEYEELGKTFYRLAAGTDSAKRLELAEVFHALCENFSTARKPLNFITRYYLRNRREKLFGGT
ncbi:MAG: hypothetical protein N3E40_00540 [Dehalococcoidia bacterium]|nr:hypothetical protein [Dehalococcoidia bacterium]